ncbi:alpha/beta fold hydrolase [Corallococcus sp. ZKHCc1 1396]|uniref:Alpha/beta fold hydrolase n=1 Tax=Corallococcus soli TaxID=2710757 RepID=A0ABR9PGF9_9BACT|nr:alpha/beta fold hydrolase [Corallococcus soli]MBE4746999.1 alpha/beta fold hydrolase [Corallococcus soli]
MNAPDSVFFPLPGLRMHALEAGPVDGPLVLLLHGFPELSESWRQVMPPLADAGFHVVAPDLRGYGGTDRPDTGYDVDTLAEDVARLAHHLQPGRPAHVVGHDWGGAIAYHLATLKPQVVDRLVVINAPHPAILARRLWNPAQLVRSWYMFFFLVPWLPERLLAARGGQRVPRMIRRALSDPSRVGDARLTPYAANMARPGRAGAAIDYYREAFKGAVTSRRTRRLLRDPPRIRAPFLLIWAEDDVALGRELTQGLEPYFEGTPAVHFLPGVGHFAPLEAPDAIAGLVRGHLERGAPPK